MYDKTSKDIEYVYILLEDVNAVTPWKHLAHYS